MAAKRLRFGSILAVLLSLLLISAPYSTNANDLGCFCSLRFTTPSRGAWCMFPLYVTVFYNNNKFILINNMQQRQAALWRSGCEEWVWNVGPAVRRHSIRSWWIWIWWPLVRLSDWRWWWCCSCCCWCCWCSRCRLRLEKKDGSERQRKIISTHWVCPFSSPFISLFAPF